MPYLLPRCTQACLPSSSLAPGLRTAMAATPSVTRATSPPWSCKRGLGAGSSDIRPLAAHNWASGMSRERRGSWEERPSGGKGLSS